MTGGFVWWFVVMAVSSTAGATAVYLLVGTLPTLTEGAMLLLGWFVASCVYGGVDWYRGRRRTREVRSRDANA